MQFSIGMHMTDYFLDRQTVIDRMSKANLKALSRVGAFIRHRARTSLRRRKGTSAPGSPPSVHSADRIATLRNILFALDRQQESLVVGPVLLNQVEDSWIDMGRTTVPQPHEFGDIVRVLEWSWDGGRIATGLARSAGGWHLGFLPHSAGRRWHSVARGARAARYDRRHGAVRMLRRQLAAEHAVLFTGGNMERPALRQLLQDIEAGKVDSVVVYKVDRLSRSLMDFARMMETFDRHRVAFVSVTQAFNTATSMGRLVLNVLLSFAQFEREMISERTRDKIAAARRKGRWSGGPPVLGYDAVATKLVVNELEAQQVRDIFTLYLQSMSLLDTARELDNRGWRTKRWISKKGNTHGGQEFRKGNLYNLLTNVVYAGKTRYKDEIYEGQHEAIVDAELFRKVQVALRRNGRTAGAAVRNRFGALLKGILRCAACDCAMGHSFSTRGKRRYRHYVCQRAQQQGWKECPAPSLPAAEIERFVVDEIRCIGRDPRVIAETVEQIRRRTSEQIQRLQQERETLQRRIRKVREKAASACDEQLCEWEARLAQASEQLVQLKGQTLDEHGIARALQEFDAVWDALSPREQSRLLALLVQQVEHHGRLHKISITFRPTGIETLLNQGGEEDSACTKQ